MGNGLALMGGLASGFQAATDRMVEGRRYRDQEARRDQQMDMQQARQDMGAFKNAYEIASTAPPDQREQVFQSVYSRFGTGDAPKVSWMGPQGQVVEIDTGPGGFALEGDAQAIGQVLPILEQRPEEFGNVIKAGIQAGKFRKVRKNAAEKGQLYQTESGMLPFDQAMGKMPYRAPRQPTAEEVKYGIYKRDPDYFKKTGSGGDKPPTPKQAIDEIGQAMNSIAKATGQEISAIDKTMMAIDPNYAERLKAMTNSPEAKAKIDNAKAAIQYYSQYLPAGYDRGGIEAMMGQAAPVGGGDEKPKPTARFNPRTGRLEPVQ